MAYDKSKLYDQALEIAKEKKCFFIEQLVSFMPCVKNTFYTFFPIDSIEYSDIKEVLDANKIAVKSAMYDKWFDSENASLQICLMKLISTPEQVERINGSRQSLDLTSRSEKIIILNLGSGTCPEKEA